MNNSHETPDFENMFKLTVKAICGCIVEIDTEDEMHYYHDHACQACQDEIEELAIENMIKQYAENAEKEADAAYEADILREAREG